MLYFLHAFNYYTCRTPAPILYFCNFTSSYQLSRYNLFLQNVLQVGKARHDIVAHLNFKLPDPPENVLKFSFYSAIHAHLLNKQSLFLNNRRSFRFRNKMRKCFQPTLSTLASRGSYLIWNGRQRLLSRKKRYIKEEPHLKITFILCFCIKQPYFFPITWELLWCFVLYTFRNTDV